MEFELRFVSVLCEVKISFVVALGVAGNLSIKLQLIKPNRARRESFRGWRIPTPADVFYANWR